MSHYGPTTSSTCPRCGDSTFTAALDLPAALILYPDHYLLQVVWPTEAQMGDIVLQCAACGATDDASDPEYAAAFAAVREASAVTLEGLNYLAPEKYS
jgi:hypothetical protein